MGPYYCGPQFVTGFAFLKLSFCVSLGYRSLEVRIASGKHQVLRLP